MMMMTFLMKFLSKKHFYRVLFFILYIGGNMQIDFSEISNKDNIIDIRSNFEFNKYNIPGSINIPRNELLRNPERYINKFDTYYFMCSKGHTSLSVSKILNALGYNTYSITGGIEKLFN